MPHQVSRVTAGRTVIRAGVISFFLVISACGSSSKGVSGGMIRTDGSSTVYPITAAVAEAFKKANPEARVSLNVSGTGGGFQRFCEGQTDIQNASRPITAAETTACASGGVRYLEVPVAHDGVTVIVHAKNTWADAITVAELKKLWEPAAQGKIVRWSQVRAGWPDQPIHLLGPGPDSGTFDFFTEAVTGRARESRTDYTANEDHNAIAKGVADDELALGYVGYGAFEAHKAALRAVAIDDGDNEIGPGAIAPSVNTVRRGTYRPLARPLFIYVNLKELQRPEVDAFLNFYIRQDEDLVAKAGCIPLNSAVYRAVFDRVSKRVPGTVFKDPSDLTMSLETLLTQSPSGPSSNQ
jgi:phosphate transport system substrate-binding protein